MKPGGGRRKGHSWERKIVNILKERLDNPDIKRGLGQTRAGSDVPDVDGVEGFWIEAKIGANTYPKKALEQARMALEESKREGCIPIAITKDDALPALVTLYFEDFLVVLERLLKKGE